MFKYTDKKVVIIGAGITGLSCVDFFLTKGVNPILMDTRLLPPMIKKIPKYVKCYFGGFDINNLLKADLIVVSPGISIYNPELQEAAKKGIDIVGDIELFCRELNAPIIAITGSNGKSTVATLIKEMAKAAGYKVVLGGNIGVPALSLLKKPLQQLYILELSSFQLETTISLKANIATVLNISEDHLNRYPLGINQYRAAKIRIYQKAMICVINQDDKSTFPVFKQNQKYISFGIHHGDYYLFNKDGKVWIKSIHYNQNFNTDEMNIIGKHNHINAISALALAEALKLPYGSNLSTLSSFIGLKHRFQLICEHKEIRWINDSKATNVNSTLSALCSIMPLQGTLWLLLGGDSKGADFSLLINSIINRKIKVFCFGQDGNKIAALCPENSTFTETMQEAIKQIAFLVRPHDTVLLSPACASFDQFRNFEHRGNTFIKLVKQIINY
ncbi:UDP-N-acetylmuramoyl-L-alanine--D-glutamate ligase [Candidatus Pantoea edessiphila]|uniref:UDP-N-acetylmuramoylalanine--D-glutamate ligase n=1 Tax=Candidatus Pantoea edessiphila TaxID=2044610 RepID=A0A2P5SYA8_9GAMM|nr:UDP-N-acetylmuramoyl-L-alanine--D-glutamate ligase [Candidatus Pantoea edessiphila]MBK4775591.1 UDP-N-acetylmuramoyl-L-alanine--D-glutamate ligase [Pantoea sp. Edef]PPI87318.1 UDP-N-acetylmuramoyl-L-alanine--D-glutamate ligase [Candidatus Pantoea edessiphila]